MTKNIIFCADGTWGNADGKLVSTDAPVNSLTNVSLLFKWLQGTDFTSGPSEMERSTGPEDAPIQIAKYVHGVGDGAEFFEKNLDGMFGIGVTARIANGYNYISRHYEEGDRIVLVGFSRGAYTVRALAGLIASEGLLLPALVTENSDAITKNDNAVRAWLRYRKKTNVTTVAGVVDRIDSLLSFHSFFESPELGDEAFVEVKEITAVAVWDTVGAMGMPLYDFGGKKYDLYNFANTTISEKIKHGLHAVAIDEPRMAFTPNLWDEPAKKNNVLQRLFAGAHTDIGGGNPDHSLSDVPLQWMIEQLRLVGVLFHDGLPAGCVPNNLGIGNLDALEEHRIPGIYEPRAFPAGLTLHEAVGVRQRGGLVQGGMDWKLANYDPSNLPKAPVK